ncbi:hypothetical protein MED134_02040 [Dokdonia sp. MED134]|uniref:hypothetical protein n=1 Tax=Dokdonia sp. MED134 TaxID=313590 RepID=UPI000068E4D4|nr:hypothetical protein [Dokdonia sp. MED134]EAQ38737.1 hypothetical protein MED134_02040 [Dokdonia sp. MED134]
MGFGGAALAANQVMRNNRNLLKQKRKRGDLSFVSTVNEKWVDPKKASFEQLMEIRKRIRRDNKRYRRKVLIVTIIAFILLVLAIAVIPWDLIFTNSFNPHKY